MRQDYDLVILGGGIAGASLALVLAKLPARVLVVERGKHPRFAIGESTIPSTTYGFQQLAKTYGVPELAEISHYTSLRRQGLRSYPKRHFWFGVHQKNTLLQDRDQCLFETFPLPKGPDVHMLREDVDAFLVSRFEKYGVDYLDLTQLTHFEKLEKGVEVTVENQQGVHKFKAKWVVDASGHQSFFAKRYGLRQSNCGLHTKSRAIFGHFRGLGDLDRSLGGNPFRYNREAGTMHHCFEGGWVWVIPFDHEVTSVGFMLNPEVHPLDETQTPEQEMQNLLRQYPSIAAHLDSMVPVRPIVRTGGRVQFTSSEIEGDGFTLTPHAAAFVEPLFSSGLLLTQMFIQRFVPMVADRLKHDRFEDGFPGLNQAFKKEIALIDQIVSGTVKSFEHIELFRQYWRVWVHATAMQFFGLTADSPSDPKGLALAYGAAFPQWRETVQRMHDTVFNQHLTPPQRAELLKEIMDQTPHPFGISPYRHPPQMATQLHPDMHIPRQLLWAFRMIRKQPSSKRMGHLFTFSRHLWDEVLQRSGYLLRYGGSKLIGGAFHQNVDQLKRLSSKKHQSSCSSEPARNYGDPVELIQK